MKKWNENLLIYKFVIFIFFVCVITNYLLFTQFFKITYNHLFDLLLIKEIHKLSLDSLNKTNIDLNDKFFQIRQVQKQIFNKNLTYINVICGGSGNIGNALIMLNNLINICENIKCRYIIAPKGLDDIIKNPIIYKEKNITIVKFIIFESYEIFDKYKCFTIFFQIHIKRI